MGNTSLFALVLVACAAVPCSAFAPWLSTPAIGIKAGTSGGKLNFVGGGRRHAISADQRGVLGATMLRNNYDLVVIGSGPTGLTAALTAAAAGRTAVIVDATPKRQVQFSGPTGLYSKALRDTAKKIDVSVLKNMGVRDTAVWRQVQEMTDDVLKASGLSNLGAVQTSNIPHLRGTASFKSNDLLEVTFLDSDRKIEVKGSNFLIATGSRAYRLNQINYDGERVFDSDTIKTLSFLPKTVTIVGAGIIAIEYAKIFSRLDCKVTMIVRGKSLAAALTRIGIDNELALELQRDLCLNKVRIIFDAEIDEIEYPSKPEDTKRPLNIKLKQPQTGIKKLNSVVKSHILLTATGRQANTGPLNLEKIGVDVDKSGNVRVDGSLRTSVEKIYAAGDVLGAPSLASTGIEQALAVTRVMFGLEGTEKSAWRAPDRSYDPRSLTSDPLKYPVGIWTLPECAFIGWTKEGAEAAGVGGSGGVGEATALYQDTIRGHVQGINFGVLKLVYTKPEGKIIGVHILGDDACELIHYGTALAQSGKTVSSVLGTMFAAVTFHELFKMAALKAVNQLSEDAWISLLNGLDCMDGDEDGMLMVQNLKDGLLDAGLKFDDVNAVMKGISGVNGKVEVSVVLAKILKQGMRLPSAE